jgi:flagellar basal-body rod protein FlgC
MSLNSAMRISASGLAAERFRLDVISGNIANANTEKIGSVDPYRRKIVELTGDENGVQIQAVVDDQRPFPTRTDFGDPNADARGQVVASNVQPVTEMVDMLGASRAYEANVAAFQSAKEMVHSALSIGKI